MKKIGVILSGCGVYDGSEIQETVFAFLSITQLGGKYICFAPDINQHHVINHTTGYEMSETRNALVEAARIARGDIRPLDSFDVHDLDALVIPGGFGAAKNLTKWAFDGPRGAINPQVKNAIVGMILAKKPVCGLCMGPTVIAKAVEDEIRNVKLTVGTDKEKSPYDIAAIANGINATGAIAEMKTIEEICVDEKYKIVTAPCYMMEADIQQVKHNVDKAMGEVFKFLN